MIRKTREIRDLEEFKTTLERNQEILQREPDNLIALESVARSYYRLKSHEDALVYCVKALEKNSSIAWPHIIQSYIYFLDKETVRAKEEAKLAIEIDPSSWETNFWWGSMLDFENKTDDGLVYLEKALRSGGNEWSLYNNLSNAYFKKGYIEKYYNMLSEMNRLKPDHFLSVTIHIGKNSRLYWLFFLLVHYLMIWMSFMYSSYLYLGVPAILDGLWIVAGVYTFRYRKGSGIFMMLVGVLNGLVVLWRFLAVK